MRQLARNAEVSERAAWALALDSMEATGPGPRPTGTRRVPAAPMSPLAMLVAARAAAREGRPTDALALTEPLLGADPADLLGDPFARSFLYLWRAEWLEAAGRWQEAARTLLWYQNSDITGWAQGPAQAGDVDGVLSAMARLRRGRLLVDHDARIEGCGDLTRVAELWRDADPGYSPLRHDLDDSRRVCPR